MDRYAGLYELGRHEIERVDGLRVAYGRDHAYGIFVEVCDPDAGDDELGQADGILVDVNEGIEGATAVKAAFDEWVMGELNDDDPMDIEHLDPFDDEPWGAK